MSKTWQVVEKDDFGTDWHQVRYEAYAMGHFESEVLANDAARKYLTHVNCNNSLAREEKRGAIEAFMLTKNGCFLGVLDGEDWYLTDRKKEVVTARSYYELEGKTEVAVREVRGM